MRRNAIIAIVGIFLILLSGAFYKVVEAKKQSDREYEDMIMHYKGLTRTEARLWIENDSPSFYTFSNIGDYALPLGVLGVLLMIIAHAFSLLEKIWVL